MSGYKTYIVALIGIAYAVAQYYTGNLSLAAASQLIETALIGAGLRSGIASTLVTLVETLAPQLISELTKPAGVATVAAPPTSVAKGLLFALLAFGAAGGLAACQASDTTSEVAVADATYASALSGINLYYSSGKADPAIVPSIQRYAAAAHNILAPLNAEVQAGTVPTEPEVLAAQAVLETLTQYLAAHSIAAK